MNKTNRTSLGHGSMKLVHRRNNQKRKPSSIYLYLMLLKSERIQPELQNNTTNCILECYYN